VRKVTVMGFLAISAPILVPSGKASNEAASRWIRVLKAWTDRVSMYFIVALCYHATSQCKERGLSGLMKDRC